MKKILFLSFIFLLTFVNANAQMTRNIDVTINSTGGCEIRIVGKVTFTIFPPRITGFKGKVIGSGGGSCPEFSLSFDIQNSYGGSGNSDVILILDNSDPCTLSSAYWQANSGVSSEVMSLLNDRNVTQALMNELTTLCE